MIVTSGHNKIPQPLPAAKKGASFHFWDLLNGCGPKSDNKKAQKIVSGVLNRNVSFIEFNKTVDELQNFKEWKTLLKTHILKLGKTDLKKLTEAKIVALRGYDRETLRVIFKAAQSKLHDSRLEAKIKSLSTRQYEKVKLNMIAADKRVYTFIDPENKKKYVFKQCVNDIHPATFFEVLKQKKIKFQESFAGTAHLSGIHDPHFSSRSVASTVTDDKLNGERRMLVKTEHIYVNGMRGIRMEMAEGNSPEIEAETRIPISEKHPRRAQFKKWLNNNKLHKVAKELGCHPKEILWDGTRLFQIKKTYAYFNPNNATTCEGLLRLQILDIINGECDRHPQNYTVNKVSGAVKGIDNDCSFGINSLPEGDVRNQPTFLGILPNNGSLMLRMPAVVTKAIQAQVEALHQNRKEYKESLSLHLSKKEIDATLVRLAKLRHHINSSDCKKVGTKEGLLERSLELADPANSYWAREVFAHKMNPQNWNHLRSIK